MMMANRQHAEYTGIAPLLDDFNTTGELSTRLLVRANLDLSYYRELGTERRLPSQSPVLDEAEAAAISAAQERVSDAINRFQAEAWFGGLRAVVLASKSRGLSGYHAGIDLRVYSLAGRCMLTFEGPGRQVTLITAEDEEPYARHRYGSDQIGPMGLQSINATADEAVMMIEAGLDWRAFGIAEDRAVCLA